MPDVTLGELNDSGVLTFGDGYRTKRPEHGSPGFRILRVADVNEGRVRPHGGDFVRREFTRAIGSKLSQPGDVLLTTKGTVGRVAIFPADAEQVVYSPQLCFFRVLDESVILPRYLAYWFESESFRIQASHRANNTDMAAYINLKDIRSLRVALPDINSQRGIAEVLEAFDYKVAANHRVVEVAGGLVNARFARAVEGIQFGPETFDDLARVGGGATPKTSVEHYWGGDVLWATPTDVTGLSAPYLTTTRRMITRPGLDSCSSPLYPAGSVLMTSRATIGAFAIAGQPMAVNQGFIVVNAKDPDLQWWLFHEMRARVDEFLTHANGATFLELPRGRFKQLRVRRPTATAAREFANAVRPLHKLSAQILLENVGLAHARDELLPLLMSGRVRIKDAEKVVEETL
jgi:type I restriction enzyme S subunit